MSEQVAVIPEQATDEADTLIVATEEAVESTVNETVETATEQSSDPAPVVAATEEAVENTVNETVETATEQSSDLAPVVAATEEAVENTVNETVETATEQLSDPAPTDATVEVEQPETEAASTSEAVADDEAADSIHTLKRGQHLQGTVKNITQFGAFVDVGLAQDGLVHISELSRKKVEKVSDAVSEGDEVEVWVKKVDTKRGRISLTMIRPIALRLRDIADDAELEGTVSRLESYGAFIDIGSERDGLVHISQITHDYIKHPEESLTVGANIKVKVLKVNRKKRQVDLSIKALVAPAIKEVKAPVAQKVQASSNAEPEEEVPTAMALAYAAMQTKGDDEPEAQADLENESLKHKQALNEVISRTLAASEQG